MKHKKKTFRYPNLSKKHDDTLQRYWSNSANPDIGLEDIEKFLSQYPYHTGALLTKVQLLIAKGRNREALRIIKIIKRLDNTNDAILFEEAEILYNLGRKDDSMKIFQKAIERKLDSVKFGIENVVGSIMDYKLLREGISDEISSDEALQILQHEMIDFLLDKSEHIDMTKFHATFGKKNT